MYSESSQKSDFQWISKNSRYLKSYSTLSLLKDYFEQSHLAKIIAGQAPRSEAALLDSLFRSVAGLFALGKYDLESIDLFITNRYFQDSLGIASLLPSKLFKTELSLHAETLARIACLMNQAIETQIAKSGLTNHGSVTEEYTFDLKNGVENGSTSEFLVQIHAFTVKCLRLIARSGLAGELSSSGSLFSNQIKQSLDKDGYAVIPGVLSTDEADSLRDLVLRIAAAERKAGTAYTYGGSLACQRIYNLLNKHEKFRELLQHPVLLEVLEHMFARDTLHDKYVLSCWHSNIIGEGGEPSILHVDAAVPEPLPEWIIRSNSNFLVDDYTEENGATLCVPGSHKFLRKPKKEDQSRSDLVPMLAPKGSLVIWDGHLWHKSGENRTKQERVALLGGFAASHLREMSMEENHFEIIKKEVKDSLSPILKRMIGANTGIKKGALQEHPDLQ